MTLPTPGVGIAAAAADAMALDAVRRGTVIVTGHARQRIASCRTTVEVSRTDVSSHPADGMRTHRSSPRCTDAPRNVAAITTLGVVAAKAGCGSGSRLDGVSNDEIANVFELPLDAIRLALLHEQTSTLLMAIGAPGLGVAGLTDIGLARGGNPVTLEPSCIVPQEGLGQ